MQPSSTTLIPPKTHQSPLRLPPLHHLPHQPAGNHLKAVLHCLAFLRRLPRHEDEALPARPVVVVLVREKVQQLDCGVLFGVLIRRPQKGHPRPLRDDTEFEPCFLEGGEQVVRPVEEPRVLDVVDARSERWAFCSSSAEADSRYVDRSLRHKIHGHP